MLATLAIGAGVVTLAATDARAERDRPNAASEGVTIVRTFCPRQNVTQLCASADAIVHGWIADVTTTSDGFPTTTYTLNVGSTLKGDLTDRIEVSVGGGIDASGHRFVVPQAPSFERDQQVLLFLHRTAQGYGIIGLEVGVCRVEHVEGAVPLVRGLCVERAVELPELFHEIESTLADTEVRK